MSLVLFLLIFCLPYLVSYTILISLLFRQWRKMTGGWWIYDHPTVQTTSRTRRGCKSIIQIATFWWFFLCCCFPPLFLNLKFCPFFTPWMPHMVPRWAPPVYLQFIWSIYRRKDMKKEWYGTHRLSHKGAVLGTQKFLVDLTRAISRLFCWQYMQRNIQGMAW